MPAPYWKRLPLHSNFVNLRCYKGECIQAVSIGLGCLSTKIFTDGCFLGSLLINLPVIGGFVDICLNFNVTKYYVLLTVSASKLRNPSSSVAPSFIISCPSSTRVQPLVCGSGTTSRALIFNWASFIHHDYERKGAKYQITTESEEDFPDYIYSLYTMINSLMADCKMDCRFKSRSYLFKFFIHNSM